MEGRYFSRGSSKFTNPCFTILANKAAVNVFVIEPIPKIDRNIAIANLNENMSCCICHKNKNKLFITKISDKLWDMINPILPTEKPNNTIGRPVIPYRKVMEGIVYVLRTRYQWKMLPREYGSGSTCLRRFQKWVQLDIFKKMWIRLLKECDKKKGIKWTW